MRPHGTRSRYLYGCRCDKCRTADREYKRQLYGYRTYAEYLRDIASAHGTLHRYARGCRCDECRRANREHAAHWRAILSFRPVPADAHGKVSTYKNWGCRCAACAEAHARACREWVQKARARGVPDGYHGTVNGYNTYGCRCDECRRANREYRRRLRAVAP